MDKQKRRRQETWGWGKRRGEYAKQNNNKNNNNSRLVSVESVDFRNVAKIKVTRFDMVQERKWEGRKMAFNIVCKAIGNGKGC